MIRDDARSIAWKLAFLLWLPLAVASGSAASAQPNPPAEASLVGRVVALEAALHQQQMANDALLQRLAALEALVGQQGHAIAEHAYKLAPVARADGGGAGTEWVLTGVNLHVRNGLGRTAGTSNSLEFGAITTNGLGNVIIGYNEDTPDVDRSGSHNLVLGLYNGYSSVAGIVGGERNRIGGPGAAVITGVRSFATGRYAVVVTGQQNQALEARSLALSGAFNRADGGGTILAGIGNITFGPTTCAEEPDDTRPQFCGLGGVIVAGFSNKAGSAGVVVDGISNRVNFGGTIVGGFQNVVLPDGNVGTGGVLVGGESNLIDRGRAPVLVGGTNQSAGANHSITPP
jgi:hypothetical protein